MLIDFARLDHFQYKNGNISLNIKRSGILPQVGSKEKVG